MAVLDDKVRRIARALIATGAVDSLASGREAARAVEA